MQDKQNQLIERISDKHLVVGVDIAQQLHVAGAVNFRGIVVGDPLAFENNEDGFASLLTPERRREKLRQEELKGNPSSTVHGGGLADLVNSLGWKGTGILILVIIIGFIFVSLFFK
ncbi:DUF6366 family protein [Peribacillus simplex]|uniref:DUF6366 family protein n=1 Tax=Peribacillus simplex TaxID=1478 RepID=UPI0037C8C4EE